MEVPLLDLKAQYRPLREEIEAALREVCDEQYFILGPKVEELEREIAAYCGAEHGIGVSSGTDALLIALMALEVGSGDEVITTPYTFFATGGAIARLGARPIFCDIEADTYNLDPAAVAAFLQDSCEREGDDLSNRQTGGRVRVLLPVHLFGQVAEMDPLMELADEYNLKVIEDAAQAIGAEDPSGGRSGSRGDIGCFSFFPSKNLGAFGDGGMCVTSDADLAERLRVLRVHGGKPKYHHAVIGGNFRLDAIQAAVLLVKLAHLDEWTAGRQENAAHYSARLDAEAERVTIPTTREGYRHIFNQYVIRVPDRDSLVERFGRSGIGTSIYYPIPLHLQGCFESLGYGKGELPVAETAARETLALPIYPELSRVQLDHVVDTVMEHLHGG